jgi:DNA mismatch repair protein MutS
VTDANCCRARRHAAAGAAPQQRCDLGPGLAGLSSGQLGLTECSERELPAWLARLAPAEILHDGSERAPPAAAGQRARRAPRGRPGSSTAALGLRKLCTQLGTWPALAGFNAQDLPGGTCRRRRGAELCRAHAGPGAAARAHAEVERATELLDLPPATHRNLELVQTLRGEDAPTLLSLLDSCRTGMGSRALRHWLTHPGRDRTRPRATPRSRCC